MWQEPIYDRTRADVDTIKLDPTNENNKGAYNYTDLNRIENNCKYVMNLLNNSGLLSTKLNLVIKTNWNVQDVPRIESINRIRNNIVALQNDMNFGDEYEEIEFSNSMDYIKANILEKDLKLIKELLETCKRELRKCNTFFCGIDGLGIYNIERESLIKINVNINPLEPTNTGVTVTLIFSEPVKIIGENENNFTAVDTDENGYSTEYITSAKENGTFFFEYMDQFGISENSSYTINNIDKISPSITITSDSEPKIVDGLKLYDKAVTISATDDRTNTSSLIVKVNNINYVLGTEITESGIYTVEVIDEAGNTSSETFKLSISTPPQVIEIDCNPLELTTGNVTITFTFNESVNIVNATLISEDGTDEIEMLSQNENNTIYSAVITKNGELIFEFKNNLDISSNYSYFIDNIEKVVPVIPIITLTSSATCVETETMKYFKGTVNYEISNANNIVLTKDENVITASGNVVSGDGVYVLTATSETGDKVSESFTIDTTGPVVSGVAHGRQYGSESVTAVIQDISPVIATYRYNNGTAIQFTSPITFTEEGRYIISAVDILGNLPERENLTFIIDRTAPTISGVTNGQTYNRDVTITFQDEQLAQNRITATLTKPNGSKVSFTSGTTLTDNGKYTLVVKDVAGNTNTVTFTISK